MTPIKRVAILIHTHRPYRCDIIRGIADYARQAGDWVFFLDAFAYSFSHTPSAPIAGDGVIADINTGKLARRIASAHLPTVNICGMLKDLAMPRVIPDNYAIGRMAAEHFLERGFRNFAFYSTPGAWSVELRWAGFHETIHQALPSASVDVNWSEHGDKPESEQEGLEKWLLALPKPVAVLAASDVQSFYIASACRSLGIRIPDELALVGVDNETLICEISDPQLSSIDSAGRKVGFAAAALLDDLMKGLPRPAGPVLIQPVGVVARQSTDTLAVSDAEVARALRFIRQNADKPIYVSDVIREAAISRRSLEYRFREQLGRSPNAEIVRAHIEHAKRLLANTNIPIARVAKSSGFNSYRRLCVVFRRETGLTPTAYRKVHRSR